MWPAVIVQQIGLQLPDDYVAEPRVHLGPFCEIDVATFEEESSSTIFEESNNGGPATAVWAPAEPTLALETELFDFDEYEVRVYDARQGRRLVAAIEIISPGNKDRPESRNQFTTKCAALLQQGVTVVLVDLVTIRNFNMYFELLQRIGEKDPALDESPPSTYAAACCWQPRGRKGWLETWNHRLSAGEPLPVLPVRLSDDFGISLDLESSYEQACRDLRIT